MAQKLMEEVFPENSSKAGELLKTVKHFYDHGVFCDLKLVAGNVDLGFNSVPCHLLVLGSIPSLYEIVQNASQLQLEDDFARIYLPEFAFDELKSFVDNLYLSLEETRPQILVSQSLVKSLGLKNIVIENQVATEKKSLRKRKKVDEVVIEKKKVAKTASNLQVNSQISLEDILDNQLKNLNLPYDWSLSEPSLFSSAEEYSKLMQTCTDSGTVIHATTGLHFDIDSAKSSYPNKIKKLAEMPKDTISALVAVGVRNGVNIIQVVSIKNWPVQATFDNVLEMFLNLSGGCKLDFYNHDRYYRFKKIASKPNRVGRALQGLKKLSPEDCHLLQIETQKQMNCLQSNRNKLNFLHLPLISVKMQFSHVSDMNTTEILDYAVLHGNDINELKIKSFSHLQVRDFQQSDWISIFIDLMVNLVEAENPLVLRNHPSTKGLFEPVDQLMFRHQAFDLLGNPGKKYCIPCRVVFPYSTPQEIQDFEIHSQEHNLKKEESGSLSCTGSAKCSKLFANQEALEEHVAKCHDKSVKGDGSYCDTCGKFLPNVHRLKKHHDAHHRQIKCKVCGAFFPGTIGLASHRDRVHSQQLPCPHCNKLLPSKVKLEYHMISHMAPEEKKYICEKCGKRFGWSHHLAKHEMNVHVRSRPYKCSVQGCNWAFNDLSNRNMHERRVHKLGPPPKR